MNKEDLIEMQDIRLNYEFLLVVPPQQEPLLNAFFNSFGQAVSLTITKLKEEQKKWEKIKK